MIYFDIDGVMRDLVTPVFGHKKVMWDEVRADGKGIVEAINDNLEILEKAPTHKYIHVARRIHYFKILSAQRSHWRPLTLNWLEKHLPIDKHSYEVEFVYDIKEKISIIKAGDILIDDFPGFETYERIILVDRHWNMHIDAPVRVSDTEELYEILLEHRLRGMRWI